MATSAPKQQTIPVQIHQNEDLIVLAAPMPGLEPQGITVSIAANRVKILGEYRGSRYEQPDVIVSEWTSARIFGRSF
jgi:HSP20 family molecular chaperone IbpA